MSNPKQLSFHSIRFFCLNPSTETSEEREELAENAAALKAVAGICEIVAGSIAFVS